MRINFIVCFCLGLVISRRIYRRLNFFIPVNICIFATEYKDFSVFRQKS